MPLDPDNPREPLNGYCLAGLSFEDLVRLGAGLVPPHVRSMALMALDGPEELERNALKPTTQKRKAG